MSSTRLIIDLDKFEPVECPAQLRSALGYHSDAEIRRQFSSWPHLQNMSFMRLYELGLQGQIKQVRLLNRKGRVVGTICGVVVNHDRSLMHLTVEPRISSRDSPALRQVVSLHVDAGGIITRVLSGDVDHHGFVGNEFSRVIAPPGWSGHLHRIYEYRRRKNDVTRLRHFTSFPGGRLYFGQWRLEKISGESFRADFHTPEPVEEEPDFQMRITLKGQRTEVATDSRFPAMIPMSLEVSPPRLEDYIAIILPEDRGWVRKVLCHDSLPVDHDITYRVADQNGVVQTLHHRISLSHASRCSRHLDSRLTLVTPEEIEMVAVNTLAMVFGLESRFPESAGMVHLPDFQRLCPYIVRLKALLEQAVPHQTISVSSHEANRCSICHQEPLPGSYPQLELQGLHLNRAQLGHLVSSDSSLFSIGQPSSWKSWISELHANGFHLSIGLGDRNQVTMGLFTDR